ncbi:MAG: sporulation protein YunB [Ruminococcus sp.]|jgi:sporulation protein YunB|nr:sporulation protein YunB [Ruminococcus sp.]
MRIRRKHKVKSIKTTICLFSALTVLVMTTLLIDHSVKPIAVKQGRHYSKQAADIAISRCVSQYLEKNKYTYDNFAAVLYDESGKPVSIETMSYTINKVQSELTVLVNNTLNKNMLSSAKIPLGSLTDSYLMAGKGPKIPLRICPEGEADVKLTGQFTSAGLNQTCHSISAVITVNMESSLPLYSFDTKSEFEFLIAQTVIVGDVPDNILGSASGCKNSESRN